MPEKKVGLINGRTPQSLEEWRVAVALWKYRHEFHYQFQVFNIAGAKGTYFVDFLITTTTPESTPLEVFGKYWHEGQLGSEDRYRLVMIESELGAPVKVIWGKDLQTQEDADAKILLEVGRG